MKCCMFEKIEDPKKKEILKKINSIGLALFLILIGISLFVPKGILPEAQSSAHSRGEY